MNPTESAPSSAMFMHWPAGLQALHAGVSNVGDLFHETPQYATVAIFHTLTSGPFAPQSPESDWNPGWGALISNHCPFDSRKPGDKGRINARQPTRPLTSPRQGGQKPVLPMIQLPIYRVKQRHLEVYVATVYRMDDFDFLMAAGATPRNRAWNTSSTRRCRQPGMPQKTLTASAGAIVHPAMSA